MRSSPIVIVLILLFYRICPERQNRYRIRPPQKQLGALIVANTQLRLKLERRDAVGMRGPAQPGQMAGAGVVAREELLELLAGYRAGVNPLRYKMWTCLS